MASYPIKAFVTKAAPSFSGVAWFARNKAFNNIALEQYKGKYVLLFFYPLNFTFVCPTEIVQFSQRAAEFRKHNCEVIGVSVDSQFSHMAYTQRARSEGGLGEDLDIPLLADLSKNISQDYGVLVDAGLALRGTFIIDKAQTLRHASINDTGVGRNVDEYLRLVQAFQHVDQHGEVCPADWQPGHATMEGNWSSGQTSNYWKNTHNKH